MNKDRREQLNKIHAAIEELKGQVEALRDDEQAAFDNIPENMQDSERAIRAMCIIDELDEAASHLDEAMTSIDDAVS